MSLLADSQSSPTVQVAFSDPVADPGAILQFAPGAMIPVAFEARWMPGIAYYVQAARILLVRRQNDGGATTEMELARAAATLGSQYDEDGTDDGSGRAHFTGAIASPSTFNGRCLLRAVALGQDRKELGRIDLPVFISA